MEVSKPGLELFSRLFSRLAFAGLYLVSVSGGEILVSVLCSQGVGLGQSNLSRPPRPQTLWLKKECSQNGEMTSYPNWVFVKCEVSVLILVSWGLGLGRGGMGLHLERPGLGLGLGWSDLGLGLGFGLWGRDSITVCVKNMRITYRSPYNALLSVGYFV